MKKLITLLLLVIAVTSLAVGCDTSQKAKVTKSPKAEEKAQLSEWSIFKSDTQIYHKPSNGSEGSERLAITYTTQIMGTTCEKEPLAKLERFIIDYYEIPKQYWSGTKYYYNYVDLNEDGKREIFVVVMGSYTSGTGGSSALWLKDNQEITTACVLQAFTLMQLPIIISNNTSSGFRELVVPYYGNAASEYRILSNHDGKYDFVEQGRLVMSLDEITGEAIMVDGNASGEYGVKLELGKGL